MTPNPLHLQDTQKLKVLRQVKLGHVRIVKAPACRLISLPGLPKQEALLVPDLTEALLSVRMLTNYGAECHFTPGQAEIKTNKQVIPMQDMESLYTLPATVASRVCACPATLENEYKLRHQRLGHPGEYVLQRLGHGATPKASPR